MYIVEQYNNMKHSDGLPSWSHR